jgi:hypothetical protein
MIPIDITIQRRSERDYARRIDAITDLWVVALDPDSTAADYAAALAYADAAEAPSRTRSCI